MQVVTLEGFEVVQSKMAQIAKDNPEWFPLGFNGIHAVNNPELFAAFDPVKALFYMSISDEMIPGFKPAHELTDVLKKIMANESLTFNNEYSIESLWHEMIHNFTGINSIRVNANSEPFAEGVVQLTARHSYDRLLKEFGYIAQKQQDVIRNGYAYPQITNNLISLAKLSGVDAFYLANIVINNKEQWKSTVMAKIADGLNLNQDDIQQLFNQAERLNNTDFKAKIKVKITNAQRNKGA